MGTFRCRHSSPENTCTSARGCRTEPNIISQVGVSQFARRGKRTEEVLRTTGLLGLSGVQIANCRITDGYGFQMLDTHNSILHAVISNRVNAIVAARGLWRLALYGGMLVHMASLIINRISLNSIQIALWCTERRTRFNGFGKWKRRGKGIPCRSPATVVSLRPETLRPHFSVCLPSGA
jgi:hypothetical protein